MLDYLFGTAGFMPHGMCLLWRPDIVAMHVGADVLTFLAYSVIALSIRRFLTYRPEFRYNRAALLSAAFVGGCGVTHLFSAVSLWWPAYGAQAMMKVTVAMISVAAAVAIWRIIPTLGAYPTPPEIEARRETEERLRDREAELRDALLMLQNADKAKASFFAAMSHDLRTPLNAILGFSEALKLEIFGRLANPKQAEYIEHIRSSGAQLLTLISDLLDLSGIESGARTIKRETVPARPLLEEILRQFEVSSASQKRRVRIALTCTTDSLYTDEASFPRIINNLLANSAKYGSEDGTITVKVAQNRSGTTLTVSDDGPGFPTGKIDAMRAPFMREKSTDDGIGIGLAIVDRLMDLHGGAMTLDNVPGGGARVALRFPAAPKPQIDAQPAMRQSYAAA